MTRSRDESPSPLYVDPRDRAIALLTLDELRTLEKRAAAALPPNTLMARAGAAAARFIADSLDNDDSTNRIWIAAGPGNNGGDALVMAAELKRLGIDADVCMPVEVKPDDARWALAEARNAGVTISPAVPDSFDAYTWLVDGLFGIGLGRPLEGVFADIAARMNAHMKKRDRTSRRLLALDIASGLSSDTGEPVSRSNDGRAQAVRASHTITFIGAKPGHFTGDGRDLTGKLVIADLGIAPPVQPSVMLNAPSLFGSHLPPRDFATNKGTFGTLAVIGGDTGMCGAPILAARMALYGGAGKVNVGFIGSDSPPYDPPHPELMLHHIDQLSLDKMTALAVGCGMGKSDHAKKVLTDILALDVSKLFDADALNLISSNADLAAKVSERGAKGDPCVITPHPLEAARLLDIDVKKVQADRIAAACQLSARYAAVAVLKGTGTIVASPDGRVSINPTGNAALATGGTGDVLGGLIGAYLAQHLPPYEAALAGVYLHGLAAEALTGEGEGPSGLTAGELAPKVRSLVNRLFYPA